MKKMICAMLAVLLLVPVFATTAFASGHGHHNGSHVRATNRQCVSKNICQNQGTCVNSCVYADENGDELCDNCKNQCADCGKTADENSDGICDHCGKCSHYRDDNKDGVCDHQAECENRKRTATANSCSKAGHHGGEHKNHH